jgi:oligopeptide/dipeptide ABC transporter ATP-binding protein
MRVRVRSDVVLEARQLSVTFRVPSRGLSHARQLRAVDGVDLKLMRGETLALVGESGSGKSTLGRALLRIYAPTRGHVLFEGKDIASLKGDELADFRRHVQMVFQDPYASLNPRLKVGDIIAEPLSAHGLGSKGERRARVAQLLGQVGMRAWDADRFPHAFSGGQRQRIAIARALALSPSVVVADEPVSALDISVQAQVINLLLDLQRELDLTLLFIAHDLAVVRHVATTVAVMYLGRIVELGHRDRIFGSPSHPYTQALLAAVPSPDVTRTQETFARVFVGDPPSPISPPSGCRFHTRCPFVMDECRTTEPQLRTTGDGRFVSCHLVHPVARPRSGAARAG